MAGRKGAVISTPRGRCSWRRATTRRAWMMSPLRAASRRPPSTTTSGQGGPVQRGRALGHRACGADHLGTGRHPQRGPTGSRSADRGRPHPGLRRAQPSRRAAAAASHFRSPAVPRHRHRILGPRSGANTGPSTESFTQIAARGELDTDDPAAAAALFAYAILGLHQDQALLQPSRPLTRADLDVHVGKMVTAFLRAYARPHTRGYPGNQNSDLRARWSVSFRADGRITAWPGH